MSLCLLGIGTAAPPHSITQTDAAELARQLCCRNAGQQQLLSILYRRSGVRRRHSVLLTCSSNSVPARQTFFAPARDGGDRGPTTGSRMARYAQEAVPLAQQACQAALADAGLSPADVTHLITVSCTGFSAPGVDLALIERLPLSPATARTHVGFMGCHGALNGLRVAKAFAEADSKACVLLCAVELCSLHQYYGWQPDKLVANALFADGAAAVVCAGSGSRWAAAGEPAWRVTDVTSTVFADSERFMGWRIGDHGFEMTLSPQVANLIAERLGPWLADWLGGCGLSLDAVGSWAVHPGGPRILRACAEAVGADNGRLAVSRQVLADFGNMSSPTVLFILQRLRQQQAPRPCLAIGFGPGLAAEAALIR